MEDALDEETLTAEVLSLEDHETEILGTTCKIATITPEPGPSGGQSVADWCICRNCTGH